MLLSLSWKNIWRNKSRSLVIIFAIVFGVIGGVAFTAFYNGMIKQRLEMAINNEVSNVQIHNPHYLLNKEINDTIFSLQPIISVLDTCKNVKAYCLRIKTGVMINSANSNTGIVINGIEPSKEKQVTEIFKYLKEGKYLEDNKKNGIIIGQKLAEKLNIKLRSKVVVTMQSSSGDITSAAFKVVGIYKTDNSGFDERNAFVRYNDLSSILGYTQPVAHEIAISLINDDQKEILINNLQSKFSSSTTQSWKVIMPELGLMVDSANYVLLIFMVIIFLALSFGIINTMLMAVLERIREIGMLMAIGMNKSRIFFMIMYETVLLTLTGSVIGLILVYILVLIFAKTGINLSKFASGLSDMGFSSIIYPFLRVSEYIQIIVMVIITGILSSIAPARKALKLNPSEAIRTS